MKSLCQKAMEILMEESNVQRVDAPVTVSTQQSDTHRICSVHRTPVTVLTHTTDPVHSFRFVATSTASSTI